MIHYNIQRWRRRPRERTPRAARRRRPPHLLQGPAAFRLGRVLTEAVAVARRSRTPRFPGARAGVGRRRWLVPDCGVHNTSNGGRRPSDVAAFSQKPSPSHAGRASLVFQASVPAPASADGSFPTVTFTTHLMEGAALPTRPRSRRRRRRRTPVAVTRASGPRRRRRFVRPTQRVGGVLYTYFAAAVRGGLIAQKPSASPRPFLPLCRASAPARRATAPRAPRRHISIPVQGIAALLGGPVLTEAVAVAAVANAAFSRRPRWRRERIIR